MKGVCNRSASKQWDVVVGIFSWRVFFFFCSTTTWTLHTYYHGLKTNSCCNTTTPNAPHSSVRVTWKPKKPSSADCQGLSSTVTWPQSHRTFMEALEDWESRAFSFKQLLANVRKWAIRFCTHLLSPRQLECMLWLKHSMIKKYSEFTHVLKM